jgi:hypothetical protein
MTRTFRDITTTHPCAAGGRGGGSVVIYLQMSEVHSLREGLIDIMTQEILAQAHDTFTVLARRQLYQFDNLPPHGASNAGPVYA